MTDEEETLEERQFQFDLATMENDRINYLGLAVMLFSTTITILLAHPSELADPLLWMGVAVFSYLGAIIVTAKSIFEYQDKKRKFKEKYLTSHKKGDDEDEKPSPEDPQKNRVSQKKLFRFWASFLILSTVTGIFITQLLTVWRMFNSGDPSTYQYFIAYLAILTLFSLTLTLLSVTNEPIKNWINNQFIENDEIFNEIKKELRDIKELLKNINLEKED